MSKEEDLNMDLFSEEPVVDMTDSEGLEYLFQEGADEGDDIDSPEEENNDETITNEDDQETDDSEVVVGDENSEEAEEVDDDSDEESADDTSSNVNLFNSLAALLAEKGLLSSVNSDSSIETEDDFISLFKNEIKTSEYSDLTDSQKQYLEQLREGIPHQKIEKDLYDSSRLESITEDVINEDADLRQRIIFQDLINKGFTEERARKNLQRSIELEQDAEDAMEALESIKSYEANRVEKENLSIKEQNALRSDQESKRLESLKKRIKSTDEVIKNFKITDAVKEKVEKNMFDVVGTDPETNRQENSLLKYRRENPEDFEHKLYYLFTITNGFQNFDSLVKNTKSQALKDLEKAVRSNTAIKDPGSPAYLQDPDSYSIDISGHEVVEN